MARSPSFTPLVRPLGSLVTALNRAKDALYTPPRTTIDSLNSTTLWPDPLQPITPLQPSGAEPLGWPFEWGQNVNYTPRSDAMYSAAELQRLSTYPLARVCIENSKDMIVRMPRRIQLRPLPGETSKARAERSKGDKDLKMLNDFFDQPNPEEDWQMWLRPILEDMLVIDAAAIFVGRNPKSGKVKELRWVAGSSITRLVEEHGFTPPPPNPAYQQLWEGWPRTDLTTLQLVYRPRNIVPRGSQQSSYLYGMCYDDKTEVLTRHRGWQFFKDIDFTDQIATRNMKTKEFEWDYPSNIINQQYTGDMYKIHSRSIDLLVTPDHNVLIDTMPRALGGGRGKFNGTNGYKRGTDVLLKAKDLASIKLNPEIGIPLTSIWKGVEIGEKVFAEEKLVRADKRNVGALISVDKLGFGSGFSSEKAVIDHTTTKVKGSGCRVTPVVMSGDQYCAFMGAYLAEGWTSDAVMICQLKKSKGYEPYKKLLTDICGGKTPYYNGGEFVVCRRGLARYTKQFGHSHEKYIPEEIMSATPRQIKIFLDYYTLGDAYILKWETTRGFRHKEIYECCSVSKRLIDQVEELFQKIGMSAMSGSLQPDPIENFQNKKIYNCKKIYWIRTRQMRSISFDIKKEEYTGTIHCVTVPNGVIYVRRNGRPAWCGNSPCEQMAPEIKIGMERLRFVYEFYGSGSIPGAVHFVPPGTSPDKIKEAQQYLDAAYAGNLPRRRQWQLFQGWQKEGHPEQFVFPKEPVLADLFDEIHTRKICFAFGTSPQRLMRQMNRASAASAQAAAEEEGTLPWMDWLKSVIDHIIQHILGYPEYEFAFDPFHELDIVKQSQADANDIKNGLYTRNEKREQRGDDPRPEPEADELSVMTAQGAIPLGQIVKPAGPSGGVGKAERTERKNGHTTFATCEKHKNQYPRSSCEQCIKAEQRQHRPGPPIPVPKQIRALDGSRFIQ